MEQLDKTDIAILRALQRNAKLTTKELADDVHLTPTPVFERLKRLERQGIIKQYIAVLDARKLDRAFIVFCSVKLSRMNHDIALDFVRRIAEIPEVTECYNISGAYDYLLKVRARDMKQYQEFVLTKLGDIAHVGAIESTFVMAEVKQQYGINI
jgi:Lrp/AsnC family leucine-responsive transcriptional regulator